MMSNMADQRNRTERLAARNKKLAVVLGLMAASIYGGYILAYYF